MPSQLHAGQLRFHVSFPPDLVTYLLLNVVQTDSINRFCQDFAKLRELQKQRFQENLGVHFIQKRAFLTAFTSRIKNSNADASNIDHHLKLKERAAAAAPDVADAQFNFLYDLNQMYPQAVVQRFSQTQYAMDQRCAAVYLNAMQKTQNFNT